VTIRALFTSFRPTQWFKNLVIFAALVFSRHLTDLSSGLTVLWAFLLFCLLSSGIYLINDLFDLQEDRKHPLKSKRPLPSGQLGQNTAAAVAGLLVLASLGLSYLLQPAFSLIALAYFLLNLGYSAYLKRVVILDVMLVAFGFVLRAVAGAVVIGVEISSWLLICTMLIALFLALSKRRHELILLTPGSSGHRRVLSEYSPYFLDQMIAVVTASTLMSYTLYTLSAEVTRKFGNNNLVFTIPFVLYGIFRYLYLVHRQSKGGSPAHVLLTDRPLVLDILLWFISVWIVLYH
jgi:4-hydroxybenzoate polyprenyltransferase